MASEVYPHLRSTVQVLQEEQQEEATSLGGSRRASGASGLGLSARSSTSGGEASACSGAGTAAAAVDEPIRFPALAGARGGAGGATLSRATQTGGGAVSRQTSTDPAPLPYRRFGLPPDPASDDEGEAISVLGAPPESGLRRRLRGGAAFGAPAPAAPATHRPTTSSSLPPLNRPGPVPLPGIDQFSVLSNGSGVRLEGGWGRWLLWCARLPTCCGAPACQRRLSCLRAYQPCAPASLHADLCPPPPPVPRCPSRQGSPRSGSGSERSAGSTQFYVQRPIPGGILQSTRAYSAAGRSSYSDSRSGASDETQPLLYSVGQRGPAAG